MKSIFLFIIVAWILILCPASFTQEQKRDSKTDIKNLQLKGADNILSGVNSVINYFGTKQDSSYWEAQRYFAAADFIFGILFACCSTDIDTETLILFRHYIAKIKTVTKDTLQEMSQGEKVYFDVEDKTLELTKQEAIQVTVTKIVKAKVSDFIESMKAIYFSNTWSTNRGYFKMRAYVDLSWREKLRSVGIEEMTPIVVKMTNKLGRDVQFNPFTEKFTIITSNGRQFENVSSDFDVQMAIQGLTQEEKQMVFNTVMDIYGGSDTPIVVLFPSSIPSPENWSRIVFKSAFEQYGESLSKGSLNREK